MRRGRERQRGIALVLVTWVFMILGVIALDFAKYMRDDATAALNLAEETRGYYVAVAGMNRTLFELEQDRDEFGEPLEDQDRDAGRAQKEDDDEEDEEEDEDDAEQDAAGADDADFDSGVSLADGVWHEAAFGPARYSVRVIDEGGLISLRMADEQILRHVVKNLLGVGGGARGMDRRSEASVATIVDSILDWSDLDELERTHGAESAYYRAEGGYSAKNGWFDSPEELLQVRGVTPALFFGGDGVPGLRDVLSPYAKSERINVRTAPAPVFQALLGIDAETAAELVLLREEEDGAAFLARIQGELRSLDPLIAEKYIGGGGPNIVRIEARGDTTAQRNQARVSAIVELSSELTEGVRVVRWYDRAPWEGILPSSSRDGPA